MTTKFSAFFVSKVRDSGELFQTLRDDAPEWLQEAVRIAHNGTMPNDWIYEECFQAVSAFDEGNLDDSDAIHEYADGRVDVYTKNLFQWSADFCLTDTWSEAESEADDMGPTPDVDMTKRLMVIQFCAIRRIAETMKEACDEAKENEDAA